MIKMFFRFIGMVIFEVRNWIIMSREFAKLTNPENQISEVEFKKQEEEYNQILAGHEKSRGILG